MVIRIKSVNIYKTLKLVPGFVLKDREDMRGRKGEREEGGTRGGREKGKKCPTDDPLCQKFTI